MSNLVPTAPARSKVPESEKVTINLGFVDLGHIDLLVSEGFYAVPAPVVWTRFCSSGGQLHQPFLTGFEG